MKGSKSEHWLLKVLPEVTHDTFPHSSLAKTNLQLHITSWKQGTRATKGREPEILDEQHY